MTTYESIQEAKKRGASDELILEKIIEQNPKKKSVFEEAKKRGANAGQIVAEILTQNEPPKSFKENLLERNDWIGKLSRFGAGIGKAQTETLKGIEKGGLSTIRNTSSLGERMLGGIWKTILPKSFEQKMGIDKEQEKTGAEQLIPDELVRPEGGWQKFGFMAEQIAEFLIPGSKLSKAEAGMKLIPKMAAEATFMGGLTAMQKGKVDSDARLAAIIGAAFPLAGAAWQKGKQYVGNAMQAVGKKIMTSVVRPYIADVKDGFKMDYIFKHDLGGSLSEMLYKTSLKLNNMGAKLSNSLKSSDEVIDLNAVYKSTRARLLGKDVKAKRFGEIGSISSVLGQLKTEIKKAAGKSGQADLVKANFIKRGAGAKGAWVYGMVDKDAKATAKVYTTFYQELKTAIEQAGPKNIQAINKTISELIPVQNAILRRIPVAERNNLLSLTDTLGLFASIFDPKALAGTGLNSLLKSSKVGNWLYKAGASFKQAELEGIKTIPRLLEGGIIQAMRD